MALKPEMLVILVAIIGDVSGHDGHNNPDHVHDHDHRTESNNGTGNNESNVSSSFEAYLYGTLSVTIVSLLSLAGIILIPCIKQKTAYNSVMLLFMSLAVGTMTSDAVLHLIPETLGLHTHGQEKASGTSSTPDQTHNHKIGEDKPFLGKMVVLLATLYGLFLLEVTAKIISKIASAVRSVQDVSHANPANTVIVKNGNNSENSFAVSATSIEMRSTTFNNEGARGGHGHGQSHGHGHSHNTPLAGIGGESTICGLKPVAFVVVVSDALHNFTDGLALGAAFAKSPAAGLATSIAVVCHELPHEVGDFAILLSTGLSVKKALLLNFVSALTCFAGLYPGILAGQQESLREWIFAAVAGGFLYVALVHMLREIRDYPSLPWHLSIALQNAGLLIGFVIIFLLAIYEDRLGGED